MNITIEQMKDADGIDVTTIKVNLKYPTNLFELHIWEFCPYSLKTQLAFEYKHLHYTDLEYSLVQLFPYSTSVLKKLETKTGYASVPHVKIQYKQGIEESWLGDSTAIAKLLDNMHPENSLFHAHDNKLAFEVALLEDWIDEAFRRPFLGLLFLNKNNLEKATKKWRQEEESIFNMARLNGFKNERVAHYGAMYGSKENALSAYYKRLDEELLPMVSDRIEHFNGQGKSFLTGEKLCIADLSLYAFLKLILQLEESNLVTRRSVLQKYIDAIENIPLGKVQGTAKKGYTRQKISLLESGPKPASF